MACTRHGSPINVPVIKSHNTALRTALLRRWRLLKSHTASTSITVAAPNIRKLSLLVTPTIDSATTKKMLNRCSLSDSGVDGAFNIARYRAKVKITTTCNRNTPRSGEGLEIFAEKGWWLARYRITGRNSADKSWYDA